MTPPDRNNKPYDRACLIHVLLSAWSKRKNARPVCERYRTQLRGEMDEIRPCNVCVVVDEMP
jgi:hypothetical protein